MLSDRVEEWVEDRQKEGEKRERGRGRGVFYVHGALEDLERTMGKHAMFQCVLHVIKGRKKDAPRAREEKRRMQAVKAGMPIYRRTIRAE
jgi:hypothetical protein